MGSLWTTFSIVRLLVLYEMSFSAASVCLRLCLFGWSIYSFAGGRVITLGVLSMEDGSFLPFLVSVDGTK
jgi:hypothetical protein